MPAQLLPPTTFRGGRLLREDTWIVAFLADWCPFCRAFRPAIESLEGEGAFETGIGDVTDDESTLWHDFDIEVVPALATFSHGTPVFRLDSDIGVGLPRDAIARARAAALAMRP